MDTSLAIPTALASVALASLSVYEAGFSGLGALFVAGLLSFVLFFALAFLGALAQHKLAKGPPAYGKVDLSITPRQEPPRDKRPTER